MTELAQKAINRLIELDDERQDAVAAWLLEVIETESYLVDDVDAEEELYRFVNENGEVDVEALKAEGTIMDLDELYQEDEEEVQSR